MHAELNATWPCAVLTLCATWEFTFQKCAPPRGTDMRSVFRNAAGGDISRVFLHESRPARTYSKWKAGCWSVLVHPHNGRTAHSKGAYPTSVCRTHVLENHVSQSIVGVGPKNHEQTKRWMVHVYLHGPGAPPRAAGCFAESVRLFFCRGHWRSATTPHFWWSTLS